MSGLFGSLNAGVMALAAQSRAIETAGRNLANVNNPDYARQRIVFGDRGTVQTPLGAQSLGLEAKQIEHLRDVLLDRQVGREISLSSQLESEQSAYEKAQAALGQAINRTTDSGVTSASGSGHGIAESLTDYFNAFQSFAARPTDAGERQTLVQTSAILVDRFQVTDARLVQVQTDLTSQITADVAEVNRLLATIAELNGQIGRLEVNTPGGAVDLRDQRQARLEELASFVSFETRPAAGHPGQIDVLARDGSGNEVMLVDQHQVTGPVTFAGSTLSAGTPATAVALSGGSILGNQQARDVVIQDVRDRIDALANQMVTAINDAYNPTGATGNFFLPTGLTAATLQLAPGLTAAALKASDGGAPGDNTIALAVAGLASTAFSVSGGDAIDGTIFQHFNETVTGLGQALSGASSRLEDQQTIERIVRGQRDGISGVSLDEEMADLMKYQRSFQASSRVITVIDDLLDTVVNRMAV
jgi:flagellar hook-associated protein 1